ncbi:hypothetical protein TNCV_1563231 [Trichonephila clavipes]|nr:hypothetical protein TNCV_1563231 [Trichonephila clavipes]
MSFFSKTSLTIAVSTRVITSFAYRFRKEQIASGIVIEDNMYSYHTSNERPTEAFLFVGMCAHVRETYVNSPPPPNSALVEDSRQVNRKRIMFPSLQRHNLLLLCNENSGGHLSGYVNIHNGRL